MLKKKGTSLIFHRLTRPPGPPVENGVGRVGFGGSGGAWHADVLPPSPKSVNISDVPFCDGSYSLQLSGLSEIAGSVTLRQSL